MTIKQLLEMPVGKEHRTGGFQLTVRTARSPRDVNGNKYQSVVLEDETGKINADILLPKDGPIAQRMRFINRGCINVIVCWLRPAPNGDQKELFIEQWKRETRTADEYYDQQQKERQAGKYKVYEKEYGDDIPGMCATHIIEGFINGYTAHHGEIPACTPDRMKIINEWVAFNMDGRMAEQEEVEV